MSVIAYQTKDGNWEQFLIDQESCQPFGFFSGERVRTPKGNATVIGVVRDFLWVHIDGENGASYWDNCKSYEDLLAIGFELINEEPKNLTFPHEIREPTPVKEKIEQSKEAKDPSVIVKKNILRVMEKRKKIEDFSIKEVFEMEDEITKFQTEIKDYISNFIKNKCVVCLDGPRTMILIPCGHLVLCAACSKSATFCPIENCKASVKKKLEALSV
eukprot:TRINITY_DN2627_c0_g1_i2.p1 TRINITY_DN2627_c0_g1~~TRINITY_DN2627_c0_g1_i2.p1  ORF type:complete len:215 (-),score=30.08 TRINITY_DN2627_c0_g1_i2:190-834(-)